MLFLYTINTDSELSIDPPQSQKSLESRCIPSVQENWAPLHGGWKEP